MIVTVLCPNPGQFGGGVQALKDVGFRYLPERRCWVGEISVEDFAMHLEGDVIEVGEFDAPDSWGADPRGWETSELVLLIDRSCDFKLVGR